MTEQRLKELKLKRHSPVGKRVGNHIYFHMAYAKEFDLFFGWLESSYNIVKYNKKTGDVTLLFSPDFDWADEPRITECINLKTKKIICYDNNQPVYHHKWMFVRDDYWGFDAEESKQRSIQWKKVVGTNRKVSSRIGYKEQWEKFLTENGLK